MSEYTEKKKSESASPEGAVDVESDKRRKAGVAEALVGETTPERTSENVGDKSGGEEHSGA